MQTACAGGRQCRKEILVYILAHMNKACARTFVTAPEQCNMAGLVPGNHSKSYLLRS